MGFTGQVQRAYAVASIVAGKSIYKRACSSMSTITLSLAKRLTIRSRARGVTVRWGEYHLLVGCRISISICTVGSMARVILS